MLPAADETGRYLRSGIRATSGRVASSVRSVCPCKSALSPFSCRVSIQPAKKIRHPLSAVADFSAALSLQSPASRTEQSMLYEVLGHRNGRVHKPPPQRLNRLTTGAGGKHPSADDVLAGSQQICRPKPVSSPACTILGAAVDERAEPQFCTVPFAFCFHSLFASIRVDSRLPPPVGVLSNSLTSDLWPLISALSFCFDKTPANFGLARAAQHEDKAKG